jgi:hypothetical protein
VEINSTYSRQAQTITQENTMSASIVPLSPAAPAPVGLREQVATRQQSWRGASGRGYTHSVYSLIECPPLPKATFILVRSGPGGWRKPLHVGLAGDGSTTLNLARIRHRGAQLGANEVHVYLHGRSDGARSLAAYDLRAALFGELGAEPSRACA